MNGEELREARRRAGWTQEETAGRLGVTQAYLSMAERGRRVLPAGLARKAVEVLRASPTALPLREEGVSAPSDSDKLRADLAALGYPGFAHTGLAHVAAGGPGSGSGSGRARARRNPAEVLLNALRGADLDTRVVEGLPWLAWQYADLDWDWAVRNAKLHDLQNRLGFVTTLAQRMGSAQTAASATGGPTAGSATTDNSATGEPRTRKLKEYAGVLERSRLVKEDTLCQDSLTEAERKWLRVNRPAEAAHWNLLTDMRVENLVHGRN
ncbi:MAG TPA: helix-turn-helix transcriptional regulator [Candidatus Acidoferrum sp.]|nr:helix-turn-helix transcriptional regulator [Candidatus Acidoferrum sp.]